MEVLHYDHLVGPPQQFRGDLVGSVGGYTGGFDLECGVCTIDGLRGATAHPVDGADKEEIHWLRVRGLR